MRSRWLAFCLNSLILIILIQQPEPPGSKAGETGFEKAYFSGWQLAVQWLAVDQLKPSEVLPNLLSDFSSILSCTTKPKCGLRLNAPLPMKSFSLSMYCLKGFNIVQYEILHSINSY
jgi:hypothetical protein